jgi:hypothetical protein
MKKAFILLVITFVANTIVSLLWWGAYDGYHIDKLFHFLGGFSTAMFFYYFLNKQLSKEDNFKNILIIIGVTALIGVLWEFYEYTLDNYTGLTAFIRSDYHFYIRFGGDLTDTLGDLLADIIGSAAFMILHLFGSRNPHKAEAVSQDGSNSLA